MHQFGKNTLQHDICLQEPSHPPEDHPEEPLDFEFSKIKHAVVRDDEALQVRNLRT